MHPHAPLHNHQLVAQHGRSIYLGIRCAPSLARIQYVDSAPVLPPAASEGFPSTPSWCNYLRNHDSDALGEYLAAGSVVYSKYMPTHIVTLFGNQRRICLAYQAWGACISEICMPWC